MSQEKVKREKVTEEKTETRKTKKNVAFSTEEDDDVFEFDADEVENSTTERLNKLSQIKLNLEEKEESEECGREEPGEPRTPPPTPYGTPHLNNLIVNHNLDRLTVSLEKM